MAPLSSSEIIEKYPVGRGLDAFRDSFKSACAKLGLTVFPEAVQQLSHEDLKIQVLDLFLALQGLSAAQHLPSPTSRKILRGDLLHFSTLLASDSFDVHSALPLLEQVIQHTVDENI